MLPNFKAWQIWKVLKTMSRISIARVLLVWVATAFVCWTSGPLRAQSPEKKVIFCSTTQVADFARNVVGDRWEVICVLGAAEDPHKYQPGNDDLDNAKRADLCLENGLHLEGNEWMKDLAKNANKPLVTCTRGIELLEMDEEDEDGQSVRVSDPHAWFNPRNAWIYTRNIRDAVVKLDSEHKTEYLARADLYRRQLQVLDSWIKSEVNRIPINRRCLVTHHDAFGYFCKRYNFKASSPLGWSTAELAGGNMKKQQKVIQQIRSLNVKSIFVETSLNPN